MKSDFEIKKKRRIKTQQEKLKLKKYNYIQSYDIKISNPKEKINIPVTKYYNSYKIAKIENDEIKTKIKGKEKNNEISFIIKNSGEYIIYGRNKKTILIPLIICAILLAGIMISYANIPEIKEKVNEILHMDKPTAPTISGGSLTWQKKAIVKISKDSYSYSGIDYYEYCISDTENFNECKWIRTDTKNVLITENGRHYVVFRAISKNGNKGELSNVVEVLIDNEPPKINDIKVSVENGKLKIEIIGGDNLSGTEEYYYKIDDNEYVKVDKNFIIDDFKSAEKLIIKVVDEVGNEIEIEIDIKEIIKEIEDNKVSEENNNDENNINENSNAVNDQEKVLQAPKISLNKLPSEILYKEKYNLPSSYEFDELGGEVMCYLDGRTKITSTEDIKIGKHTIECTAIGNNGLSTKIKKDLKVNVQVGEETEWDGWIRLNLYYPENSIDWQWRLGNESEIRTGINNSGWQEYTGPILIRLTDVENVYIRYTMNGEIITVPPVGRLLVDIQPNAYELKGNQTTSVKIEYDSTADIREYKINDGEWQPYKGRFSVGKNTLIEARVIKYEKVYDNDNNEIMTRTRQSTDAYWISEKGSLTYTSTSSSGGLMTSDFDESGSTDDDGKTFSVQRPSTYLEGPIITQDPTALTESTMVKIEPQEPASAIYISIDGSNYQLYTEEVEIRKNCTIKAYYIRESDGKKSNISYYEVENIIVPAMPYVSINVSPSNYLSEVIKEATVTLSGNNYDTLEYSYDNVIYYPYEEALKINSSATIYAKGTNSYGETIAYKKIVTTQAPTIKEELIVGINVSPEKNEVQGVINKATITINYDEKATEKYYKIGNNGKYLNYTGPFEITQNAVIYAVAISSNGYGNTEKEVNYLTTGIIEPRIIENPISAASTKMITINYDKNAVIKKYKIDNGIWQDYNEPIEITENSTIYAYNENVLGYSSTSSKLIKVQPLPEYTLIDKGHYYVLRLNYPTASKEETREYKWKTNGIWKTYNENLGILLIKNEYKESSLTSDGVKIEDDKGNEIIYTDHYYFIEEIEEVSENIFMRWSTQKPKGPEFIVATEPSKTVKVGINYDTSSLKKYYKIVKPNGSQTNWLEYTGPIEVNELNTMIYAKSVYSNLSESEITYYQVTNIDTQKPTISALYEAEKPKNKITVLLIGEDDIAIDKVGYAKGKVNENYFENNGIFIKNKTTFEITENSIYTICAIDKVGNITTREIEITNIDNTKPEIEIKVLSKEFGTKAEVEINYGNCTEKKYKIGASGEYKDYESNLEIKSTDVLNLKNEDGSLTIYAKGTNEVGNEIEVEEKIYILDLDAPKVPEIEATGEYPILTEKGIKDKSAVNIIYDEREDIVNYYSEDEGNSWKVYEGTFESVSKKIIAKSVKKSGLVIYQTYEIIRPDNSITNEMYDGDELSSINVIKNKEYLLDVEKQMQNKSYKIKVNPSANVTITLKYYDENNNVLYTENATYKDTQKFIVKDNTTRIGIQSNSASAIYEIYPVDTPTIIQRSYYPKMNLNGFTDGYNIADIYYMSYMNKRYYSLNNGEKWEIYDKTLILKDGINISAKSSDLNGNETEIETLKITDLTEMLDKKAYDKNRDTITTIQANKRQIFDLKDTIQEKILRVYVTNTPAANATLKFYNEKSEEIQSVKVINEVTVSEIPIGATRVIISAGSSSLSISEVNLRGDYNNTDKVNNPVISIDTPEWTQTKLVNIVYPEGNYVHEYSIDGENWIEYETEFTVDEQTTIYARSSTPLKVVATSTYQIVSIDSTIPTINMSEVPDFIFEGESYNLPTSYIVDNNKSGGSVVCKVEDKIYTNTKNLPEGLNNVICTVTTGVGKTTQVTKTINVTNYKDITSDSILSALNDEDLISGYYNIKVTTENETVTYPVSLYVIDGNQEWNTEKVFGRSSDVATSNSYAKNMVIVKVNGDLTIGENGKVRPYYTSYGGPKGFTLYVTGTLTNNGTIDNSHGAYAEGQNVYLWKNTDDTYEYIPKVGAAGGSKAGNTITESPRATGGGAYGASRSGGSGGAGAAGTSYSGGSGGGAGYARTGGSASANGGSGGNGVGANTSCPAAGGAGNPAGCPNSTLSGTTCGESKTGGLLVIYANEYKNNGSITATGGSGGTGYTVAGSSGGGSINIFTNQSAGINKLGIVTDTRYLEMLGTANVTGGFDGVIGGTGTVNIGRIQNGQYYDLKEIIEQEKQTYINSITFTGESILSIVNEKINKTGYYFLNVNDQTYPVHAYVYNSDQEWKENKTFGDASDVSRVITGNINISTYREYAQNMVIVKVNGDLTIGTNGKVQPYYTSYGGPKGFTLYVTGKLTNNGIIDNSHGAYAEGQNVYLWKNADGTYEYVPAVGGTGGAATSGANSGYAGSTVSSRATGGGGSGRGYSAVAGSGGNGTSYSGGVGSGSSYGSGATRTKNGNNYGGTGGNCSGQFCSGGAGNPAGTTNYGTGAGNGTGGLLTIYANNYINNGVVSAIGQNGGSSNTGGGSSGGGSINIFYMSSVTQGTTNVSGGGSVGTLYKGGAGGAGTVSYTQITMSEVQTQSFNLQPTETSELIKNPVISIDTSDWSMTKKISIAYPNEEYTNEYSLDNGETWIEYTGEITIDKEITIFARSKEEEKVISASTFTITKIDNEEPIINILLEDRILKGTSYQQVVDVTYTKSGGITECTIDNNDYLDISTLDLGSYTLTCTTTTGSGKITTKLKDFEIYEGDTQEEEPLEETLPVEEIEGEE